METVTVTGTKRAEINKKTTKAVRKEGLVPCVMYGGSEVVHFTAPSKAFKHLIYTPDFKIAEIEIDGQSHKCILQDMQFHPVTETLLHLDLLQLVDGQKVKVEIPVGFKGVAPGVKTGGSFIQKVRRVKVKTTPDKIVDRLFIDISELELGFSVRVRDIELEEGMEIMNPSAIPVASVEIPRALKSAEAEEEAAAAEDGDAPADGDAAAEAPAE